MSDVSLVLKNIGKVLPIFCLALFFAILTYIGGLVILPLYGIFQDWLRAITGPKDGEFSPSEDTKDFTQN